MSVKSAGSLHGSDVGGPVIRCGYLRKLKTSRKKYFVLRSETCESSARLEYYDSEKKFNSGQAPKRCIPLKTCFNINKQSDTKHKHVIALYTKDDRFCVILENEEDVDAWLKALLSQQRGEDVLDGESPRPTFEHVWQVTVCNRGLGATHYNNSQVYRLCLTDKTLSLIKKDCYQPQAELSLSSIRSCGSVGNYFYLEVGRSSSVGAGELWLETEDQMIAQNVQHTVFHAMSSSSREELGPKSRNRSSSATESSKPTNDVTVRDRRQTLTGATKPNPHTQDQPVVNEAPVPCTSTINATASGMIQLYYPRGVLKPSERRHSIAGNNAVWPGIVNHQRTRSLPLANPAPLTIDTLYHPPRTVAKRTTNQSSKCFVDGRVRSDSMPSRPRTTSEGNHHIPYFEKFSSYIKTHRPTSLHGRDISHSPPSGSPVSPPSAASTDSAGSSLSIDENEPWPHEFHNVRQYCTSLTPDDPIVEEHCENCIESLCVIHSSPTPGSYMPMQPAISSDDGYVDMSPRGRHHTMSPAASMSSVTSGTPSTDMRFAEYSLEKVSSYLQPSEDEESSAERTRTYSMGARPYKTRFDNARDRAWSVGSKSKKIFNRVLPPHGAHPHSGPKSSSAPMLSNSRLHSSHSSIDPMDDLMELDFTRPPPAGYMEMRPGYVQLPPVAPVVTTTAASHMPPPVSSGYVSMRPGHNIDPRHTPEVRHNIESGHNTERNAVTSPYVSMCPGTSPAGPTSIQNEINREQSRPDYMDMDSSRRSVRMDQIHPSNMLQNVGSPVSSIASTSPMSQYTPHTEYMDMNFHRNSNHNVDTYVASPVKSTLSGYSQGSPSSLDYIDMDYVPPTRTPNEGYVEMSLGTQPRQTHYMDYANRSMDVKKKERKTKKEKTRSQPITIQNTAAQTQKLNTTSPIYHTLFKEHKYSSGTSPKMCLPLSSGSSESPYSSLPRDRQRSRKNSRRDSKDSSSSSVTTPSSSSTMFPISINSPSSPISKSPSMEKSNKIKIPAAIINAKYNQASSGFRKDDYTSMDFERTTNKPSDSSDYVNYTPTSNYRHETPKPALNHSDYALMTPNNSDCAPMVLTVTAKPIIADYAMMSPSDSGGDYALMQPSDSGDYALMTPGDSRVSNSLTSQVSNLDLSETNRTFRPIDDTDESLNKTKLSSNNATSRPISVSSVSRPSSESSELGSTSSTIVGSRPTSVNSDKIKPDTLHYASLDLAPTIEEQRSSVAGAPTTNFTYAEIDFIKSEGLKTNHLLNNTKIKH